MSKLLLAMSMLSAGAGAFVAARHSTTLCHHQANIIHENWCAQTQLLAAAQSERSALDKHIRELNEQLALEKPIEENPLWCLMQTNGVRTLRPELRERLLNEVGFTWESSDAYVFVSKEAVSELGMKAIRAGQLTEEAASVLALTPEQQQQVQAAIQDAQREFNDWARAHTERTEPKDDVVARYTLESDPAMSVSNNFATTIAGVLGTQRTELIMPSARNWMISMGIYEKPTTLVVKRSNDGSKLNWFSVSSANEFGGPYELLPTRFPPAFRPVFPNGWSDVAAREGFELPQESPNQ